MSSRQPETDGLCEVCTNWARDASDELTAHHPNCPNFSKRPSKLDQLEDIIKSQRLLPDVSFSIDCCVVCGALVVATGLIALCSDECSAKWASRPPPLSDEQRAMVDLLAESIAANLKEFIGKSRPPNEEIIQAACDAAKETLLNTITITGTIKV